MILYEHSPVLMVMQTKQHEMEQQEREARAATNNRWTPRTSAERNDQGW